MAQEQCSRCGAVVNGGTEGCRRLFHQLLAQEYGDPAYGAVNLLAVDAHALQHPEDHGVKNNGFHLARLCWLLEHGGSAALGAGPRWLQASFDGHMEPPVLDPPRDRGSVTVADVHGASSPEDHAARVRRWAASVWEAWSAHHAWARRWVEDHA